MSALNLVLGISQLETPERLRFHKITAQGWNKQIPVIQRGTFSAMREVYNHIHSLPKLGTVKLIRKEKKLNYSDCKDHHDPPHFGWSLVW